MPKEFPTDQLLKWFAENQRSLPWREKYEPYGVWVSEIMLQQTRMEQALPYYKRFLKKFPNVKKLAQASEQEVLKAWEGLGYYSRARNLQKAAKIIVKKYNGKIPGTKKELLELPGIGEYVSAAIAGIAFEQNEAAVDGNVIRVLARYYGIQKNANEKKYFQKIANEILPNGKMRNFNQGLMELGALVCVPVNPLCAQCPLQENCYAFGNNVQNKFPVKVIKKKIPVKQFIAIVLEKNGRYGIRKRYEKGLLANLWEFPLIEIENSKILDMKINSKKLEKLFEKECVVPVKLEKKVGTVKHAYTHFKQIVHAYKGKTEGKGKLKWVKKEKLRKLPLSKVNHKILEKIGERPLSN